MSHKIKLKDIVINESQLKFLSKLWAHGKLILTQDVAEWCLLFGLIECAGTCNMLMENGRIKSVQQYCLSSRGVSLAKCNDENHATEWLRHYAKLDNLIDKGE